MSADPLARKNHGKWFKVQLCHDCRKIVAFFTDGAWMRFDCDDGVCRACGAIEPSVQEGAHTTAMWVVTSPWWMFWRREGYFVTREDHLASLDTQAALRTVRRIP